MTIRSASSFATRCVATIGVSSALAWPMTDVRAGDALPRAEPPPSVALDVLSPTLKVGDLVFIRIGFKPFAEVAAATGTWTNHVGVVVDVTGGEPRIGESAFPLSRITTLSKFVRRSENGRFAVLRLKGDLTPVQERHVLAAAERRSGIFYDTGFDLHSRREFCSRYAREVLNEATGHTVGEVETFGHLLASTPDANVAFWTIWYIGRIPWNRETVTPASMLRSEKMRTVFDGAASTG